jgi:REP element-mobilizing transposase RayT
MKYFINQRKSIRLNDYDYSKPGAYFITVCTKDKKCLFGKIREGQVILSELGNIANQCWINIPNHFPDARSDAYIIMPNHIHGIIEIINKKVGAENFLPLPEKSHQFRKVIPRSVSSIVRGFKIGVTKWCNQNHHAYFQWQRNYYEHIIRDGELEHIREYINLNPELWEYDRENEKRLKELQYIQKWARFENKVFGRG